MHGTMSLKNFLGRVQNPGLLPHGRDMKCETNQRCCCIISAFTEITLVVLREDEDRANEFSKPQGYYSLCTVCSDINSDLSHTVYLFVLCGSENIQRLFPYTALTDWFLLEIFNPLKPSGHYTYPQFNIQQFYVMPTHCIYLFCVDLRTNSDYFPIQH